MSKKFFEQYVNANPMPPKQPHSVANVPNGFTEEEQIIELDKKVTGLAAAYNGVMSQCYNALDAVKAAAEENGAYYSKDDVKVETAYYTKNDKNIPYTIIRVKKEDRKGNPIKFKLYAAFNNPNNVDLVEENPQKASQTIFADKLIPAHFYKVDVGVESTFIYNGSIIVRDSSDRFLLGFDKDGKMVLVHYGNYPSDSELCDIENCYSAQYALIVNGGKLAVEGGDTEFNSIYAMGQTGCAEETLIIAKGYSEDTLTPYDVQTILFEKGCITAAVVETEDEAVLLDKGNVLVAPKDKEMGDASLYWYISREPYYAGDYQYELGETMQLYGQANWQYETTGGKVDTLLEDLGKQITTKLLILDSDDKGSIRINGNTINKTGGTGILNIYSNEINVRNAKITNLANGTASGDAVNYNQLKSEQTTRSNADRALGQRIDTLNERTGGNGILTVENPTDNSTITVDANTSYIYTSNTTNPLNINDNIRVWHDRVTVGTPNNTTDITGETVNIGAGTQTKNVKIKHLVEPVDDNDATTKKYVDDAIAAGGAKEYLPISGGTLSGDLNFGDDNVTGLTISEENGNGKITIKASENQTTKITQKNVHSTSDKLSLTSEAVGVAEGDNITLDFYNGEVNVTKGENTTEYKSTGIQHDKKPFSIVASQISVNNARITGMGTPINDTDATTKNYVDTKVNEIVSPSGDLTQLTLSTGNNIFKRTLNMTPTTLSTSSNFTITANGAATARGILITTDGDGSTISCTTSIQGNQLKIKNLAEPVDNTDAATKYYVDTAIELNASGATPPTIIQVGADSTTSEVSQFVDSYLVMGATEFKLVKTTYSAFADERINFEATYIYPYFSKIYGNKTFKFIFENSSGILSDFTITTASDTIANLSIKNCAIASFTLVLVK